ncbi:MAG: hypothetical protein M3347_03870 [Armatimonadota bacterium]|nr:hypothetical protein [Armatimonadota bacterium]
MANSNYSVMNAVKPDGFVDFYELLNVSPDADTEQLRNRINELYSEAQANRDHRNLAKRHEYQLLLELLPQCRTVLLDAQKRQRYDEYAAQAKSGSAPLIFDAFIDDVTGRTESQGDTSTDALGIRDAAQPSRPADGYTVQAHTQPVRTPPRRTPEPPPPAAPGVGFERLPKKARISLMGSAVSVAVFCGVLIISLFILHQDTGRSLLVAGIWGVVAWVITHLRSNKG